MTAVDDLIANIKAFRASADSSPLVCDSDLMIAALQEIQTPGSFISSTVLVGAAIALTTNIAADITSIALPIGDWDIVGSVFFQPGGGTTATQKVGWISDVSATVPTLPNEGAMFFDTDSAPATVGYGMPVGKRRFNLLVPTTIFLSTRCTFAVSTQSAYGFIGARKA